jgi:hypothetical protein
MVALAACMTATASSIEMQEVDYKHARSDSSSPRGTMEDNMGGLRVGQNRAIPESSVSVQDEAASAKQFEDDHDAARSQHHDMDLILGLISKMLPNGKNDSRSIAKAHNGRMESTLTSKKTDAASSAVTQQQGIEVRHF